MIVLGAVLLLPSLQGRLAMASGPIANWTDRRFATHRAYWKVYRALKRSS